MDQKLKKYSLLFIEQLILLLQTILMSSKKIISVLSIQSFYPKSESQSYILIYHNVGALQSRLVMDMQVPKSVNLNFAMIGCGLSFFLAILPSHNGDFNTIGIYEDVILQSNFYASNNITHPSLGAGIPNVRTIFSQQYCEL
ncbi:unnamed protein product [Owenia fusiformis]|uniref:Uncharacterized protein n=1 Tax=Owenia fusiformis TaxID=6347 RepID=A0A8J1XW45_OWEFU|nr:unnamed protein product [Owenia fusiformis]